MSMSATKSHTSAKQIVRETKTDLVIALKRRFAGMAQDAKCTCAAIGGGHEPPCPRYYWQKAFLIVDDVAGDD